jgi:hypothetical protein
MRHFPVVAREWLYKQKPRDALHAIVRILLQILPDSKLTGT